MVPDKAPEITYIPKPGQAEDKTYVESGRPELYFKVVDDYQVKKVFLCIENVVQAAAGSDEGPNATEQAPAAPGCEADSHRRAHTGRLAEY